MTDGPWFWRGDTGLARFVSAALLPVAHLYDTGQRLRWRVASPKPARRPVICIGAATVGGAGKTPCALLVARLLAAEGVAIQFQTRGYGGALKGPVKVDPSRHRAGDVGDEALLLACAAPVWAAKSRADGVAAAIDDGAGAVIMDDGFQNPTVAKTISLLIIDEADIDAGKRVLPAGPMREPADRAAARADIVLLTGTHAKSHTPSSPSTSAPTFNAWLTPVDPPAPTRVIAFCGIGRPKSFFDTLRGLGFDVAGEVAFPDHHPYTHHDIRALTALSNDAKAPLITTEKDRVRLPPEIEAPCLVLPVEMTVNDEAALKRALLEKLDAFDREN